MARNAAKTDARSKLTDTQNKPALKTIKPHLVEIKFNSLKSEYGSQPKFTAAGKLLKINTEIRSHAAKENLINLKQCAEESRKIFNKKSSSEATPKKNPVVENHLPENREFFGLNAFKTQNTYNEVFTKQADSAKIRERYKQEIDNLRQRLLEMRNHKRPGIMSHSPLRNSPENIKTQETNREKNNPSTNKTQVDTIFEHKNKDGNLHSEPSSSQSESIKSFSKPNQNITESKPFKQKTFFDFQAYKKLSQNLADKTNSTTWNYKPNLENSTKENDSIKPKLVLMTDNSRILFGPKSSTNMKKQIGGWPPKTSIDKLKSPKQENNSSNDINIPKAKPQKIWSTLPSSFSVDSEAVNFEVSDSESNKEEEDVHENVKERPEEPQPETKPTVSKSCNNMTENQDNVENIKPEEPKEKNLEVLPREGKNQARLGSGDSILQEIRWPIRHSLFPNTPPYWSFSHYDAIGPVKIPVTTKRFFKWKLTNITPNVVRKILLLSGFQLSKSTTDWLGTWGKHMKSYLYKEMRDNQKLNHFPGTYQLGRKDRLWRNLQTMCERHGKMQFSFMPFTYILPEEMELLRTDWMRKTESGGDGKWIVKPPASARGIGIKVVNKWSEIPKKQSRIVQLYISKPLLINGNKFDIRLYVLVTSYCPLIIYLWPEGLARFASSKYTESDDQLCNKYVHLTNYSINKNSEDYTSNDDINACQGHKWTLTTLWEYLKQQGVNTEELWKTFQDMVIKAFISCENFITPLCTEHMSSRYNCYELFGIDILLDYVFKPWLIEINISPSLHSASPLDIHVKAPLVKAVFDLAQFHIPQRATIGRHDPDTHEPKLYTMALTNREKSKHYFYETVKLRKEYLDEILNDLTSDDIRHLITAEDEFEAKGQFERIFPSASTFGYLSFMEKRYYNRLFDAWEQRYGHQRESGISYLQRLCAEKLHLRIQDSGIISKSLIIYPKDYDTEQATNNDDPKANSVSNVMIAAKSMFEL